MVACRFGPEDFRYLNSLCTVVIEQSTTEVIATCSIPSSRPPGCARPVQTATAAQGSPHDHQDHAGYPRATPVSSAEDARFGVMAHSHVGSANGINTLRRAVTRSLHKELCLAESEHSRTPRQQAVLTSLVD
jgi:hypothetical protein